MSRELVSKTNLRGLSIENSLGVLYTSVHIDRIWERIAHAYWQWGSGADMVVGVAAYSRYRSQLGSGSMLTCFLCQRETESTVVSTSARCYECSCLILKTRPKHFSRYAR